LPADLLGSRKKEELNQECSHVNPQAVRYRLTNLPADILGSRRKEGLDQECSHEEAQAARYSLTNKGWARNVPMRNPRLPGIA